MLVHEKFRPDLILHTNEDETNWVEYDMVYINRMKRYIKRQLIEKFSCIKGMRFLIERPLVIRKQLPLMMALWELGGIVVVYDLHYVLMKNPLYKDFNANIDATLVEHDDLIYSQVTKNLVIMDGRIHELKYFDQDPEFFNDNVDSPVLANENDVALVVYTSGSNRAPQQMSYTHKEIIAHAQANIGHFGYRSDHHAFHYKSFHHGGMCVNYMIATLIAAQHHYYKIQLDVSTMGDFFKKVLSQVPVNLLNFTFEMPDELIDAVGVEKSMADQIMVICTHWIQNPAKMTRLFSTGQVARFVSPFGCRELLSCLMLHDISPESWKNRGANWDPAIFERVQDDFWEYTLLEDQQLAVRAPWQTEFYSPGDRFEHVEGRRWRWLGRNTQIKRQGLVVRPDVVDGVLKTYHAEYEPMVIADYQHKKLYCLILKNPTDQTESQTLVSFNETVSKHIDQNHLVDLVMYIPSSKSDVLFIHHTAGRSEPSLSVLRYLARQKLGLQLDL